MLPQTVNASGHEVIHQVVVVGDGVEDAAHPPRLVTPGNPLKAEVRRSVLPHRAYFQVLHSLWHRAAPAAVPGFHPHCPIYSAFATEIGAVAAFSVAFLRQHWAKSQRIRGS